MNRLLKFTFFTLTVFFVFQNSACKKEDYLNKQPSVPILTEPQNGAVTGSENVTFKWQCSDTEDDVIAYTFYISKDSINWTETPVSEQELTLTSIEKGEKYYWKVKAENFFPYGAPQQEQGESVSSVSYFYTNPPGVTNLREESGDGSLNLYWNDPANTDHIEISCDKQITGVTLPIIISAGTETVEFTGLQNGTVYSFYVKVYDIPGHSSMPDTIQSMPLLPLQIHDVDFNVYNIVTLGTQTWMRENLKATKYQDGSPFVNGYGETIDLSNFIGSESDKYGLYYYAVIVSGGYDNDKNVCPCGYHIPTNEEWKTLERYLGMSEDDVNSVAYNYYRGANESVGGVLKSSDGWNDYNGSSGNGTDLYGFRILPAGLLDVNVEKYKGEMGVIWTSTGDGAINTARFFSNSSAGIMNGQTGTSLKASIRCVKD